MSHLKYFYGDGCADCDEVFPLIKRIEKEAKVQIDKIEVWNNKENDKLLDTFDKKGCKGIPFFVNTKTNATICGVADYEEIVRWALEE